MTKQELSKLFFDNEKNTRNLFLALSFTSGFIELGSVVYFIFNNFGVMQILLAGLCYQIGNLVVGSLTLSKRIISGLIGLGIIIVIAIDIYASVWLYYLVIIISSIALQSSRRIVQENIEGKKITTFTKRSARMAGFLAAGLAASEVITLISINLLIPILLLVCLSIPTSWFSISAEKTINGLAAIMVMHQTHYFSYALWVPLIFVKDLGVHPILLGFFFILGWISYINTEKILGRFNNTFVFILGHIFVGMSLLLLSYGQDNIIVFSVAWFLSGLGGGTVYCLKRLSKENYPGSPDYLDFWEDTGHVTGLALSIFFFVTLRENYKPFILSSSIAITTAFFMFLYFLWRRIYINSDTIN